MKVIELLTERADTVKKRETRDTQDLRKDFLKWKKLVNIPTKTIHDMLNTERSLKTGLSERDKKMAKKYRMSNSTARAILRLRTVPLASWKTSDVNWLYRQLKYIERNKKRDLPLLKDDKPTETLKNLWAWGHIPNGLKPGKD